MKVLITLLCFMGVSFAQVPTTSVSGFDLNYQDPSGAASADHLIVPGYSFEDSPSFNVEQQAGNFILETEDESFTVEDVPEMILDLEKVSIENLNLETNISQIFLSLKRLSGNNSDTSIDVQSLLIDCKYQNMSSDIKDEILNSCVNNIGQIKIQKLIQDGKDSFSNADFKFNRNQLNFRIKAAGFNVKGSGKAYYTPGLLRIKIEKAKVGILSVKNRLFRELEAVDSPNIRVVKPWIEIDI